MDSSSCRRLSLPIPDVLKGQKGSWAGSTAHGLSDHRLAGTLWQFAVTNAGCFLSHKQNGFRRSQNILEVFSMEVCGEFLMCLWGVSFSAGTGSCCVAVRWSQRRSWLEGICCCAMCAGLACRHWAWGAGEMPYWDSSSALHLCWVMDTGTRRKRKWGDRPKMLNITFCFGHSPFAKQLVLPSNSKEILLQKSLKGINLIS